MKIQSRAGVHAPPPGAKAHAPGEPRLLTLKELCGFLGCSRVSIWRLCKDGVLREGVYKSGRRRLLFDRLLVLQQLEQHNRKLNEE